MEGTFGQGETTKTQAQFGGETGRRRSGRRTENDWPALCARYRVRGAWDRSGPPPPPPRSEPSATLPPILDPHRICVTLRTRLQHHRRRRRRAASGGGFIRRLVKCKYFALPISALLFACRARCVKYPSPSVRRSALPSSPVRYGNRPFFAVKTSIFVPTYRGRRAVRSDCEIRTFKARSDSFARRL